jgi:hypothetical protein
VAKVGRAFQTIPLNTFLPGIHLLRSDSQNHKPSGKNQLVIV